MALVFSVPRQPPDTHYYDYDYLEDNSSTNNTNEAVFRASYQTMFALTKG